MHYIARASSQNAFHSRDKHFFFRTFHCTRFGNQLSNKRTQRYKLYRAAHVEMTRNYQCSMTPARGLAVLWSCLAVMTAVAASPLPVFKTNGSNYQVGYNVGARFRENIQKFYSSDKVLSEKLIPFYNTDAGKKVYDDLLQSGNEWFPAYMQELNGTAEGAQVNFTLVFLMTIRLELLHVLGYTDDLKGCSDVFVNTDDTYAFGHNEDTAPEVKELAYFVDMNVTRESDDYNEQFLAYTYPGMLPGTAFGFNRIVQFGFSLDALYPTYVALKRPPRDLVMRAIAGSFDPYYLLWGLSVSASYGFSTNVGWASGNKYMLSNYEHHPIPDSMFGGLTLMNVLRSTKSQSQSRRDGLFGNLQDPNVTGHYFHFNMYDHTPNVPEVPAAIVSSQHRKARAEQMQVPKTLEDIKNILGDTKDQQYPIYRTPRPTDQVVTAATAIFDLKLCTMAVMTENPKTAGDQQTFKFDCDNNK